MTSLYSIDESYDNELMFYIIELNQKLNNFEYIIPNNGRIIDKITAEDFVKYYRLLSPKEFEKYHGGICWDYVQYEADYFRTKLKDVEFKTYYHIIDDGKNMPTHTFLLFSMRNKWYWFESSWKSHAGVYGFKTEKDALAAISYELGKEVKHKKGSYMTLYDTLLLKPGMSCQEFMDYLEDKVEKIVPKHLIPIEVYKGEVIEESVNKEHDDSADSLSYAFTEGMITNKADILYNKDKFDSGEINLCFVVGLSGSGKSTLSHSKESKDIEVYELDDVQQMYEFSDDNLKEYGDLIYSFFKGPGKVFRYYTYEDLENATNPGDNFGDKFDEAITIRFVDYAKQYASSHKNKKYIIEGIWLLYFCKPEDFDKYAVYIKGTSAIVSRHRAALRDSNDTKGPHRVLSYLKNMLRKDSAHQYKELDNILGKWYDHFKEEPKSEMEIWMDDDIDTLQEIDLSFLDEADYSKIDKTSIVRTKIYPLVDKQIPSSWPKVKRLIGQWITNHYEQLYAPAPYKLIPFTLKDYDDFWKAFGVNPKSVEVIMKQCYFYDLDLHPRCAKNGFTAVMMAIIHYHIKKGNLKDAKLATVYTSFSGQFYPSLHSHFFKYGTKKEIMDYVINNKLSEKYELRKTGSVFGTIEKYSDSFIVAYKKYLLDPRMDDNDYKNTVQQLRDRVKSFLKNISVLYYDAVEKNEYMNYSADNLDTENFHLTNTNTARAASATEKSIIYMTTRDVNYQHCAMVSDQNVRKDEVKNIMSSIYHNPDNLGELRQVTNVLITNYLTEYPEGHIGDIDFINFAMQSKPNSKDKDLMYVRETITKWLNANSVDYVRRKSRVSTAISYYRSVQKMIVLSIAAANK